MHGLGGLFKVKIYSSTDSEGKFSDFLPSNENEGKFYTRFLKTDKTHQLRLQAQINHYLLSDSANSLADLDDTLGNISAYGNLKEDDPKKKKKKEEGLSS